MRSDSGPAADLLEGVLARLRAHREELVGEILTRVHSDALDRAGGDEGESVAGLRTAVAAAVEYVLEGIELERAGRSPEQRRCELVVTVGRDRCGLVVAWGMCGVEAECAGVRERKLA